MKRFVFVVAAFVLMGLMAQDVYAHGGSFRGPNGGVPPGLREPSDPEPPPPPPSDPGDPGGPTTPGDNPQPPTTPPDTGHDTPTGEGAPPPTAPTKGPTKKKSTTKTLTFESWRFWWAYNNDDILNLKAHVYSSRTSSSSPIFFSSKKDEENRRNAQRPTQAAIVRTIIPALERRIYDPDDNEDIHGGALVALGKVGTGKYIPLFKESLYNKLRSERGRKIEFGRSATESAILAIGLLPDLDEKAKEKAREVCLEAIQDKDLYDRERCWAAVCLGLQRDTAAIEPLTELLRDGRIMEEKVDIPAGILVGLGLIGDKSVSKDLADAFENRRLYGNRFSDDRLHAFVGYALGKIRDPETLPVVLKVLKSRRYGRIAKRSAAIAAGWIAASPEVSEEMKDESVQALWRFISRTGKDPSSVNFAIIALSQIGTKKALDYLVRLTDDGKYGQRPFAALGLGTHVFYNREKAREGKVELMDQDYLDKIKTALRRGSEKFKDADTRAAFFLARGLVKDKSAKEEMALIAAKRSSDPVLRGFACVALGLLGDADEVVKDAMKEALKDRKSDDLRRDAATGLALLRDAEVVDLLLEELKRAKSFAVQGQIIRAIGTIGDHTAIDPLVKILDAKRRYSSQTRAMAAVGLGMIGDLQELPKLGRISKNYNYRASVPELDELLFIL